MTRRLRSNPLGYTGKAAVILSYADEASQKLQASMSEDDLLAAIIEAAMFLGWRVHHDRRSDKALQQGHAGFPDIVLARHGRLKFFELKTEKGQLSTEQFAWQIELPVPSHAVEYRLVRPADLDDVIESLR